MALWSQWELKPELLSGLFQPECDLPTFRTTITHGLRKIP
jgi:hypothetical protein